MGCVMRSGSDRGWHGFQAEVGRAEELQRGGEGERDEQVEDVHLQQVRGRVPIQGLLHSLEVFGLKAKVKGFFQLLHMKVTAWQRIQNQRQLPRIRTSDFNRVFTIPQENRGQSCYSYHYLRTPRKERFFSF